MELIESLMFVVLGFAPTLAGLEIAWRLGLKRAIGHEEGPKIHSGYPRLAGEERTSIKGEGVNPSVL
jgi:hypothetical protein